MKNNQAALIMLVRGVSTRSKVPIANFLLEEPYGACSPTQSFPEPWVDPETLVTRIYKCRKELPFNDLLPLCHSTCEAILGGDAEGKRAYVHGSLPTLNADWLELVSS